MEKYIATMVYNHDNYVDDRNKKYNMKNDMYDSIKDLNIPWLKKHRALNLAKKMLKIDLMLSEENQKSLVLGAEVWNSDCLEYNVNCVTELIESCGVKPQMINVNDFYQFCNTENRYDIKYVKMSDNLRKSKEGNPIIILINNMFVKPFIINGNHRIIDAYSKNISNIEAYVIDADCVIDCLITDGYKKAYNIYKGLYRVIGAKINC